VTARVLDEDLVRVRSDLRDARSGDPERSQVLRTLYWGDEIDLVDETENAKSSVRDVQVRILDPETGEPRNAFVRKRRENGSNVPFRLRPPGAEKLLEVVFVDVEHGDATLIRTPGGRNLLIDGAEEPFITRLLRTMLPAAPAAELLVLDALVVSHGDGEHLAGLAALADAHRHPEPSQRVQVRTSRVYHNGLVKRPEKVSRRKLRETERFGATRRIDDECYITELIDDPRSAKHTTKDFARWKSALSGLVTQNGAVLRRLRAGDHDAFDFLLAENIEVLVLGPVEEPVEGRSALRFLRDDDGDPSADHTINRHSVMLKLSYGNVRMLIGGELGVDGARRVLDWAASHHPPVGLESEIFRVPHHGRAELLPDFFQAVAPVVSVVTACDETPSSERARPRADLLAALGRFSRSDTPAIFSTGAVQIRTDGERVLVAPEPAAGQPDQAYAFRVDAAGAVTPATWAVV
jgi:beta-lactamase superfamily II metal-dependent hydrolase